MTLGTNPPLVFTGDGSTTDLADDSAALNGPAGSKVVYFGSLKCLASHNNNTHTHRFTALLEYVRDHPGEQVPER